MNVAKMRTKLNGYGHCFVVLIIHQNPYNIILCCSNFVDMVVNITTFYDFLVLICYIYCVVINACTVFFYICPINARFYVSIAHHNMGCHRHYVSTCPFICACMPAESFSYRLAVIFFS